MYSKTFKFWRSVQQKIWVKLVDYFVYFCSLSQNITLKELLKSVCTRQSYCKNITGIVFVVHGVDLSGNWIFFRNPSLCRLLLWYPLDFWTVYWNIRSFSLFFFNFLFTNFQFLRATVTCNTWRCIILYPVNLAAVFTT